MLIFDNNSSGYTAKVADFGYSTQWATASDLIQMPRSQPWAAPEWHHRGFTPAQATLMDTYSFGMLVLWLIGYTDQNGSDRYFKIGSQAASKASELIPQVIKYTLQMQKIDLSPFFDVTLAHNTADRCSDFRNLQKLLSPERYFHRLLLSVQLKIPGSKATSRLLGLLAAPDLPKLSTASVSMMLY